MARRATHTLTILLAGMIALAAAPVSAQTVDEVVALHDKSRGGAAHWKTIESERLTGTLQAAGLTMSMVFVSKRPGVSRQELTFDVPGQGPISVVNVFDGTRAWTINPMMGGTAPQEVQGQDADGMRDQADMDGPLVDYKTKGNTVELVGEDTVNGRKAHHLKITRQGQPTVHYYIDAETGSELKIAPEAVGAPVVELSDHRLVNDVLVPFHIRLMQAGQLQAEVTVTSVEFNVPTDDTMFKAR